MTKRLAPQDDIAGQQVAIRMALAAIEGEPPSVVLAIMRTARHPSLVAVNLALLVGVIGMSMATTAQMPPTTTHRVLLELAAAAGLDHHNRQN